jgi:hypothetical protein
MLEYDGAHIDSSTTVRELSTMREKVRVGFNNAIQAHCIVTAERRHQMIFVYTAAPSHPLRCKRSRVCSSRRFSNLSTLPVNVHPKFSLEFILKVSS